MRVNQCLNNKKASRLPSEGQGNRRLISHSTHGEEGKHRCWWCATVSSAAALRQQSLSCGRGSLLSVITLTNLDKALLCATRTLRVAVAHTDGSHTSKQVQISPAINIPQPLHVSLVDEHWLLVVGDFHGHRVTVLSADLHHPLLRHSLSTMMNRVNNKI